MPVPGQKQSLATGRSRAAQKWHPLQSWSATHRQLPLALQSFQPSLPASLKELLDQAAANDPASTKTQQAFDHGFVFAMDVKDADELPLSADFAACDDGWYRAARDLWRVLVHHRDEETGATLFESESPEDLAETAFDDLHNYRFFRYLGDDLPATVEDAYGMIHRISFFPPTHIWLGGKFVDISELSEVRLDSQVVQSSRPGCCKDWHVSPGVIGGWWWSRATSRTPNSIACTNWACAVSASTSCHP